MGVSCSADRNIKAKINRDGIWIEKLESNPGKYIPEHLRQAGEGEAVKVNLNQPMSEILAQLSQYPVSTRLSLSGTIIVARDIAHAKLEGAYRQRRGAAAIRQRSPDLLRRSGQDAGRLRLRLSGADHRRPHGLLR
ncbi:fumarate hydratase C-terminal domain-containing protein [Klebsiella pneumoniae subsp. pneumoniae]|nr:fumarate hydratase C-terminal domain-containing protein [Klebsiella pneumoniae subsp. pneumoniae]